jgi:hypothetical protein
MGKDLTAIGASPSRRVDAKYAKKEAKKRNFKKVHPSKLMT